MKKILKDTLTTRVTNPLRIFSDLFDRVYFGKDELEIYHNIKRFRSYLEELVLERKQEKQLPGYQPKDDFISILLEDDLFANDTNSIIDECAAFMVASTQTTAVSLFNILKNVIAHKEVKTKCRNEILSLVKGDFPKT